MYPIFINTLEQYLRIELIGFKPLLDWKRFTLDSKLRSQLQDTLFGYPVLFNNIPQANQKFYRYCWDNTLVKVCEECGKPLHSFAAIYISHILTRAAYPKYAHDPRNFNLLCPEHHRQWEGTREQKKRMRIYEKNRILLKRLMS